MTGLIFSRLTVLERSYNAADRQAQWRCLCDCGREVIVRGAALRTKHAQSCGCFQRERTFEANFTHGKTESPYYKNWMSMMSRCYNKRYSSYSHYGGAGIKVCNFISDNPENLIKVIGEKPSSKHSIDRYPNKNGSYTCGSCPSCAERGDLLNVRWATQSQQLRNTSRNRILIHDGIEMCATDWAARLGISPGAMFYRIRKGLNLFSPKTISN